MPGVRQSLLFSFVDKHLRLILQVAATLLLARFLTPEQFGVFTIGLVVVYVADTLREFGSGTFLIQEKELTPSLIHTSYGFSLLLGLVCAGGVVLASSLLAKLYHSSGVQHVLFVLAPIFVMSPFSSVVAALLRREMRFGTLLRINGATSFATNVIAMLLAILGFGFMSLAWSRVAGAAVNYVLSSLVRPRDMSHWPSMREWRRVGSFGIITTGATVITDLGTRAPDLLIGYFLGLTPVGLFGRGVTLIRLYEASVTSTLTPVAVSSFAMRHRSGNRFADHFLKGISITTAVAWPFFSFVALMAYPATRILFGPQWDASIPITRLLCVAAAITSCTSLNTLALQATGAIHRILVSQWIIQSAVIGSVFLACHFSLIAVGYTMIAVAIINVVVSFWITIPVIHISRGELFGSFIRSLAVTLFSGMPPLLVVLFATIDARHIWIPFGLAGIGAAVGFVAGAWSVQHPLWEELQRMLLFAADRFVVSSGKRSLSSE